MGKAASARGDYERAEAEFRRALELNPIDADAHRGLADTFEQRARLKEAEAAYKNAIELRPNDWRGYNLLGAFYVGQSCLVQAEPYFRKVERSEEHTSELQSRLHL